MRVYVLRKWPLRGINRFVCWNITRISLWLLRSVYFLQSTQNYSSQHCHVTSLTQRHGSLQQWRISMYSYWRVCGKIEYRIDVCRVTRGAHIENLYLSKNLFQFSCGCEQFHWGRSFGFFVINVITENIMKRPVYIYIHTHTPRHTYMKFPTCSSDKSPRPGTH